MVCVRSLVPKLKNSASSAISSAAKRRARDLDHGADQIVELCLLLLGDLFRHAVDDLDLKLELLGKTNERNHHLGPHLDAFAWTTAAASKIARACISEISG